MSNQLFQDGDLPPPYSAAPEPAPSSSSFAQPSSPSSSSSSFFSHQLSSIRSQILHEQAARQSARDQTDGQTLALLVPPVEDLLASIAGMHPPPALVEATLVPGGAVGPDWTFSDADERRSDEVRTVVKVRREDPKLAGDRKKAADAQARDDDLWWSDEAMARRLAKHLQPERAAPPVDRQTVRAHVAQNKKSRWGLFKKDEPPPTPPASASASGAGASRDDVTMSASAEEVTFRRENEMGIWESRTGWGIVVRVRIRNARGA